MEKTRQELFELVWSMPMTKLSKRLTVNSAVGKIKLYAGYRRDYFDVQY